MKRKLFCLNMALVLLITLFPFSTMSVSAEESSDGENAQISENQIMENSGNTEEENKKEIEYPIAIDAENFPDKTFREYIEDKFDIDKNGFLAINEISNITEIYVKGESIESLEGIEYFTNLEHLYCGYINITELDLSNNTNLISLGCFNTGITELDLQKNTKLESLECANCALSTLDLSTNTNLNRIQCGKSGITLTLILPNTSSQWTSVVSGFEGSIDLFDGGSTTSITSDKEFYKFNNYTKINLNSNQGTDSETKVYYCRGWAFFDDLAKAFVVPSGKELSSWNTEPDGSGTEYSVNESFWIGQGMQITLYAQWEDIDPATSVEINATNFPDIIFREYVADNYDLDGNGIFTEKELDKVSSIVLYDSSIKSLAGIEYFDQIRQLSIKCNDSRIKTLDLSKNTKLKRIYCGNNENSISLTLPVIEGQWADCNRGFEGNFSLYNGGEKITVDSSFEFCSFTSFTKIILDKNVSENNENKNYYTYSYVYIRDLSKAFKTPTGKELLSWNTEPDGTGKTYSLDVNYGFSAGKELTLYAQWADIDPTTSVEINEENFPDKTFREYVEDNFDKNGDGILTENEKNKITHIEIYDNSVRSLKGIEYFTSLTYLCCEGTRITELDLSANTNLKSIQSGKSSMILSLTLPYTTSQWTSIVRGFEDSIDLIDGGSTTSITSDIEFNRLDSFAKITLNGNQGQNNEKKVYYSRTSFSLGLLSSSFTTPTGQELSSWNTEPDGSGTEYILGKSYGFPEGKELTLYAQWVDIDPTTSAVINEENFPDNTFREYVEEQFDTDGNGILSKKEMSIITNIYIEGRTLKSVKGIEYFTNIKRIYCSGCSLSLLDLSSNINLESVGCGKSGMTLSLTLPNTTSQWTTASHVFEGSIDLLDGGSTISISSFTEVNILSNYSKIILNSNQGADSKTKVYYCRKGAYSNDLMKAFSAPSGKELSSWNTEPDGSGTEYLLSEEYGFSEGEELTLYAQWEDIDPATSVVINEENFPDKIFRGYIEDRFDENGNGILTEREINNIDTIDIYGGVNSLSGIEYFKNLRQLICFECNLSSLDLTSFDNLDYVYCSGNKSPMNITVDNSMVNSLQLITNNTIISSFTVSGMTDGTYSVFENENGYLAVVDVTAGRITIPSAKSSQYTAYWIAQTENGNYYYKPGEQYTIPAGLLIRAVSIHYSNMAYRYFGILDGNGGTLTGGSTFSGGYAQYVSGSDLELYDTSFIKEGFSFVGVKGKLTGTVYYSITTDNFLDILFAEAVKDNTAYFEAVYDKADGNYIVYNGNGCTTAEGKEYILVDGLDFGETGLKIADNKFVSDDIFLCWCDKADGSGKTYLAGETANISESMTLYAIFGHSLVKYNHWDGSSETSDDGRIDYYPLDRNNDYVFKGWNTKEDGSGLWYHTGTDVPRGTVLELYEVWEPVSLNGGFIKYIGEGLRTVDDKCVVAEDNLDFSQGSVSVELIANPFVLGNGETFYGWSTESRNNFSGELYQPGETITISDSTELYAKTGKNRVIYHFNTYNLQRTLTSIDSNIIFWSNGYRVNNTIFKGWNTEEDGSGTWYLPGQTIPEGSDLELYEIRESNVSTGYSYILANYNDGSNSLLHIVSMDSETEEVTMPENGGYGWYKGTIGYSDISGNKIIAEGTKVQMHSGDVYSALNGTLVVRLHDNLGEDSINEVSIRTECPASPVSLRVFKEKYEKPQKADALVLTGFNSEPDGSGHGMSGSVSQGVYDFYAQWKLSKDAEIKAETSSITDESYKIPEALADDYSSVSEMKSALEEKIVDKLKEGDEGAYIDGSAFMDINLSFAGAGQSDYSSVTDNLYNNSISAVYNQSCSYYTCCINERLYICADSSYSKPIN